MAHDLETAVFGGGCFWCTEAVFQNLKGVASVTSGYAGGDMDDPDYYKVAYHGNTGHAEVIKIEFDPEVIRYSQLLEVFFAAHDATMLNQQGADIGPQYRSIILYTSERQKAIAEKYIKPPMVTELKPLDRFYTAEEYHQNYYKNNSGKPYCQIVINPKLDKIRKKFSLLLKD